MLDFNHNVFFEFVWTTRKKKIISFCFSKRELLVQELYDRFTVEDVFLLLEFVGISGLVLLFHGYMVLVVQCIIHIACHFIQCIARCFEVCVHVVWIQINYKG